MLNKKIEITSSGINSKAAGNDYHETTYYVTNLSERINFNSAIEKLLIGIFDITKNQRTVPTVIDTKPYTIEDKISHNNIVVYQKLLNDYIDKKFNIEDKVNTLSSTDPNFYEKLKDYILAKYKSAIRCQNDLNADDIIEHMKSSIETELRNYHHNDITLEEISFTDHVIFYIFSKCEIFEKPPSNDSV